MARFGEQQRLLLAVPSYSAVAGRPLQAWRRAAAGAAAAALAIAALGAVATAVPWPGRSRERHPLPQFLHAIESKVAANGSDAIVSCAKSGDSCWESKCCQEPAESCYAKDLGWAECRKECRKGFVKPGGNDLSTPWLCSHVLQEPAQEEPQATPSLFCWALVQPHSYEVALVILQLRKNTGIFRCDDNVVLSNESFMLRVGPPKIMTEVMEGSLACQHGGKWGTALNSEIFARAWRRIFEDGRYAKHDWTVKADPDTVFLPHRLRLHLSRYTFLGDQPAERKVYLNDCQDQLHGPIEVISRVGMEAFNQGIWSCEDSLQPAVADFGEDVFLRRCLAQLGVRKIDDFGLLKETNCEPFPGNPIPCNHMKVSYHPLKSPEKYLQCLGEAHDEEAAFGMPRDMPQEPTQGNEKKEGEVKKMEPNKTAEGDKKKEEKGRERQDAAAKANKIGQEDEKDIVILADKDAKPSGKANGTSEEKNVSKKADAAAQDKNVSKKADVAAQDKNASKTADAAAQEDKNVSKKADVAAQETKVSKKAGAAAEDKNASKTADVAAQGSVSNEANATEAASTTAAPPTTKAPPTTTASPPTTTDPQATTTAPPATTTAPPATTTAPPTTTTAPPTTTTAPPTTTTAPPTTTTAPPTTTTAVPTTTLPTTEAPSSAPATTTFVSSKDPQLTWRLVSANSDCRPDSCWLGPRDLEDCAAACFGMFVHATTGDQNCKCVSEACNPFPEPLYGASVYEVMSSSDPRTPPGATLQGACPPGYSEWPTQLDGDGKSFTYISGGVDECSEECHKRQECCTSFEYHASTGKCGTYTGGKKNMLHLEQYEGWVACVRSVPMRQAPYLQFFE